MFISDYSYEWQVINLSEFKISTNIFNSKSSLGGVAFLLFDVGKELYFFHSFS